MISNQQERTIRLRGLPKHGTIKTIILLQIGAIEMKLITIDLDGTLLGTDGKISPTNVRAIQQAKEAGHAVSISTGRSRHDTQEIVKQAALQLPITTGNGGETYQGNERLFSFTLSNDLVQEVIQLLEANEMYYEIYTKDGIKADREKQEILYKEMQDLQQDSAEKKKRAEYALYLMGSQHGIIPTPDLNTHDYTEEGVYKIFMLSFNDDKLQRVYRVLNSRTDIALTASGEENLEISHQDAGKGNGLKLMANHFNIPIENTFVLGDSMNDYSMFQVAGTGIAMENAIDELKAISNYITTTNDEHGVAYAIENYILT